MGQDKSLVIATGSSTDGSTGVLLAAFEVELSIAWKTGVPFLLLLSAAYWLVARRRQAGAVDQLGTTDALAEDGPQLRTKAPASGSIAPR